ncbi:MAG: hypothetical protein JOZ82_00390 [Marmoricola sp.]|nr:hypothetical protein [Marmoricola sp.]
MSEMQEPVDTAQIPDQATARTAANWAKRVTRLDVAEVPAGATGINVAGKRLNSPIQGFGRLWQKTYQVHLPGDVVSPRDLIAMWKQKFPQFWPEGNHFYGPLTGIAPGEVALIEGTLPGRLRLSTGVMVLYADEESFTLMTPEGHVFAGWVTFSAATQGDETVAQAQVLMRAGDPIFELGMSLGGHRQEDKIWGTTLLNVAKHYGITDAEVEMAAVCVDKRRQWKRWTNVFKSAAIGSTLYMLAAPFRAVFGRRG